jgi:hypothetical protein
MRMIKMLNEGNQIHNFISGFGTVINYGSDFLISYGSGSTSHKVKVPTVPVPGSTTLSVTTCGSLLQKSADPIFGIM